MSIIEGSVDTQDRQTAVWRCRRSLVGRTAVRAAATSILFIALMFPMPLPASACSSPKPSAALAAESASHIVLVRVLDVRGPRGYPTGYGLRVIENLKGDGGRHLEVEALTSSLCGDRVALREGFRAVIAFDVPFRGETLAPYWVIGDDGTVSYGDGEVPADGGTLEHLLAAINGLLPDTATLESTQQKGGDPFPYLVGASLGVLAWLRRSRRVDGSLTLKAIDHPTDGLR